MAKESPLDFCKGRTILVTICWALTLGWAQWEVLHAHRPSPRYFDPVEMKTRRRKSSAKITQLTLAGQQSDKTSASRAEALSANTEGLPPCI